MLEHLAGRMYRRIEQVGSPEEVYHHPATPFVYNFLGNVDLFHGRVRGGRVLLGAMAIDLPEPAHREGGTATVYLRPHLLDIDLGPTGGHHFRARVVHINPAGLRVKVELISEWGAQVQAELTQDRYQALGLTRGADVFVTVGQEQVFVT